MVRNRKHIEQTTLNIGNITNLASAKDKNIVMAAENELVFLVLIDKELRDEGKICMMTISAPHKPVITALY